MTGHLERNTQIVIPSYVMWYFRASQPVIIRSANHALSSYWISFALSALSIRYIPPGSILTAVMLTTALTALFSVWTVWLTYRSCDEYIRLQILKCVVYTAIIGGVSYAATGGRGEPDQSL
jgi:hypothetical protein